MPHSHTITYQKAIVKEIQTTSIEFINKVVLTYDNGDINTYYFFKYENPALTIGTELYFSIFRMRIWIDHWFEVNMLYFGTQAHIQNVHKIPQMFSLFQAEVMMLHPPFTNCKLAPHNHLQYNKQGKPTSFFKLKDTYYIPFYAFHYSAGIGAHPKLNNNELYGFYLVTKDLSLFNIDPNQEFSSDNQIQYEENGCGFYIELPVFIM